jgi:WD40 repeat protein
MCGGTDGKVYNFKVALDGDTGPTVTLKDHKVLHHGPVFAMQVFPDGSFLSGGRDGYLRLWTNALNLAWTMEKDNMLSEWQLSNPISNFFVFKHQIFPRGVDFEEAIIAVLMSNKEIHRFPLEPSKYLKLESEWSPATPFSVVWPYKDSLNTYHCGLTNFTTRIHAAAPLLPAKTRIGGSGGGGTQGNIGRTGHTHNCTRDPYTNTLRWHPPATTKEGQITGLALHPVRDQYIVVVDGAVGGTGEGAIQLVEGWENKRRTNICQSQVTYLHAGALCVDYSVDGSVCCVGLSSGDVVFISSQTSMQVHTINIPGMAKIAASPVLKVRFSACGRLVALALESRDVVVLKGSAPFRYANERRSRLLESRSLLLESRDVVVLKGSAPFRYANERRSRLLESSSLLLESRDVVVLESRSLLTLVRSFQ